MKIKKEIEKYCLKEDATILDAIKVINEGEERTCLLVDSQMKLLRVITDGDIRRALLKKMGLDDPAKNVHNRKPYVINEKQGMEDARRYLSKRIFVLPITNDKGQVKGILRLHDVEPFFNIRSREVFVLGLGYVGLTLAAVLADEGFVVYGYDTNQRLINTLQKKKSEFYEKGIENYLQKHIGNNLRLVTSPKNISADIHIISVGTPIKKDTLEPQIGPLREAAVTIGGIIKKNDLVILRSTVPIGTTRKFVLPILEKESKLKAGNDFYLAFCPERTAEGKALEELRKNPQLIGGHDSKSTELASRLFNENTHTVIDVGSLEAAEMCKLMDNTFRDTMFAYSNQMALLCEKVGLNLGELIEKVNLGYHRNMIPKPSPGVGGACLSKDPYILIKNFKEYNLPCPLIGEARRINEMAPQHIYKRSHEILKGAGKNFQKCKVFIIGFAFKGEPVTSDLRESTSLWFLKELKRNKIKNIWGFDPIVKSEDLLKEGVKPCSIADGFSGADAVFFMNNHRSYSDLRIFELMEKMKKPALFFDGWQIFSPHDIRGVQGIIYAGTGVG